LAFNEASTLTAGVDGLEPSILTISVPFAVKPKTPVPTKYIPQMQFQLACTGRAWCDFVSFNNELPEHLQLFVKRVHRDDEYIANMEKEVTYFLNEVADTVNELEKL